MSERITTFAPNPKQLRFATSKVREVFLTGPNQWGGKTYTLRFMLAVHATGRYPDDWEGPRFDKPPVILCFSKTMDSGQRQITDHVFAEHFEMTNVNGPGWISPSDYEEVDIQTIQRRCTTARVDHRGSDGRINGKSIIFFMSYEMGWQTAAGYTADLVLGNETPPPDVYTEMKARINATKGLLRIGACPLEEEPIVYYQFKDTSDGVHMDLIEYTIDDCTHLSREDYEDAIARWKNHPEAEARLYGRPCRSGGIVFPYSQMAITVPPGTGRSGNALIGLDVPHGVGHFAAVMGTHDVHADVVTIHEEFKSIAQEVPLNARRVILMGGDSIPVAWPHDGGIRDGTGQTIAERYRQCGVNMLSEPAHFYDGSKKSKDKMTMVVEAQERFATGRLKISQSCPQLLREIVTWRFKNGKIIQQQDDHLIDALLKLLMMLRYALPVGEKKRKHRVVKSDYDFYSLG